MGQIIKAFEQLSPELLDAIRRDGIEGWGLRLLSEDLEVLGRIEQVGPFWGCDSETCQHISHGYRAPTLAWIPNQGELYYLGWDHEDEKDVRYYLLRAEGYTFLRLVVPRHKHHRLYIINENDIPLWVARGLKEHAEYMKTYKSDP